jgi:hypothetical protein
VHVQEQPIKGSPFQVEIRPVPDVIKSVVAGPGLEEAQEDTETHFTVTLKDKLGNSLPFNPSDLSVHIVDEGNKEIGIRSNELLEINV